jgi:hypothetical protein
MGGLARFGSHTPMVTGQTYVVRYSPMAPRAIRIMREQLQQSPLVSQELQHKLTRTPPQLQLHCARAKLTLLAAYCN